MIKVERLPEVEKQIDRIRVLKDYELIPEDVDKIFYKIRKAGKDVIWKKNFVLSG